jgi:DNA adenine methylase
MTAYHGGKQRIGQKLAQVIYDESMDISEEEGFQIKGYCEPFSGMLGVFQHIPELFKDHKPELEYNAGDKNQSVIMMWKAVQKGWKPPSKLVSKEQFMQLKYDGKSSAEKGFIGHFYGYMGKYFQPFDDRHTSTSIERSTTKISNIAKSLKNVSFTSGNYTRYSKLENYIIYCDPPYSKQAHYYTESGEHVTPFDHEEFWEWCREMSKNNLVFVSEYKAPDDFDLVWSTKSKTTRRSMTEKLYVIKTYL